jgi:hypothetical protein
MENIKAQIALDLVPLLKHLYNGGIIGIYPTFGAAGQIQMTEKAFFETFPEVDAPEANPDSDFPFRWAETVNGVEFFALSEEGVRK